MKLNSWINNFICKREKSWHNLHLNKVKMECVCVYTLVAGAAVSWWWAPCWDPSACTWWPGSLWRQRARRKGWPGMLPWSPCSVTTEEETQKGIEVSETCSSLLHWDKTAENRGYYRRLFLFRVNIRIGCYLYISPCVFYIFCILQIQDVLTAVPKKKKFLWVWIHNSHVQDWQD